MAVIAYHFFQFSNKLQYIFDLGNPKCCTPRSILEDFIGWRKIPFPLKANSAFRRTIELYQLIWQDEQGLGEEGILLKKIQYSLHQINDAEKSISDCVSWL